MALISCKECGNQLSTNAKTCPHCGNINLAESKLEEFHRVGSQMTTEESKKANTGILITLVLCVIFIIWFWNWLSR